MKKIIFFALIIGIVYSSCKKNTSENCPTFWGTKLPYTFYFILKQNGSRLNDSILNTLKLSYYQNGIKQYIADFGRAGSDGYNLGAMITQDIGFKSGDINIKDFYLEFATGDIDTLYVDYRRLTPCQADTSTCQCLYPRYTIKFNNTIVLPDPSITVQTVYLFKKQ